MWEIIRKNIIKSTIAFLVMTTCYLLIYGTAITILLFIILHIKNLCFILVHYDEIDIIPSLLFCFAVAIPFALFIYLVSFIIFLGKPYKFQDCNMYQVSKCKSNVLYNVVEEMIIASGLKHMPKVYILDSNIANAYSCGISPRFSSIVVSKKLLECLKRDELQGIIAHEISHIINRDTLHILHSGILFVISSAISNIYRSICEAISDYTSTNTTSVLHKDRYAAAIILSAIFLPISFIFLLSFLAEAICYILFMFISKNREYLADACACQYTRYPKGLADALLKLQDDSIKLQAIYEISNLYNSTPQKENPILSASVAIPLSRGDAKYAFLQPETKDRIKILLNMTSADYREYEKEFQKFNNKNLIPQNVLQNSKTVPIKKIEEMISKPETIAIAACALNTLVSNEEQIQTIKENKELLKQNIQKHREVENIVRDLAGYKIINCECDTILKIPPVYNNQIIICPHCKKKHVVKF